MQLNQLETSALRLAIARGDPLIRVCLENFRVERSEAKLADSLRMVALKTIQATLQEQGISMNDDGDLDYGGMNDSDDDDEEEEEDISNSKSAKEVMCW